MQDAENANMVMFNCYGSMISYMYLIHQAWLSTLAEK